MKMRFKWILIVAMFIVSMGIFVLTKKSSLTGAPNPSFSPASDALGPDESASLPLVKVVRPLSRTIRRTIKIPGEILPWEQATLYAKIAGYLKNIRYDKGDWVKKGEVIAEIAVPELEKELAIERAELAQIEAELKGAQAEYQLREIIYRRSVKVQSKSPDLISQEHVDEAKGRYEKAGAELELARTRIEVFRKKLEKTQTLLDYTKIRVPFDGVITNRWVDPGAMIQAATTSKDKEDIAPLVHLMDMNTVRVQTRIPEPDVPYVKEGNQVEIKVAGLPGESFKGQISRFAWALDPGTKTMLVEIDVVNKRHLLRPGMYAQVVLTLEMRENALTLPAEALITESNRSFVYAVTNDTVKKVPIKIGMDNGMYTEIIDGLKGGEECILAGKNLVREGDRVKMIQEKKEEG